MTFHLRVASVFGILCLTERALGAFKDNENTQVVLKVSKLSKPALSNQDNTDCEEKNLNFLLNLEMVVARSFWQTWQVATHLKSRKPGSGLNHSSTARVSPTCLCPMRSRKTLPRRAARSGCLRSTVKVLAFRRTTTCESTRKLRSPPPTMSRGPP